MNINVPVENPGIKMVVKQSGWKFSKSKIQEKKEQMRICNGTQFWPITAHVRDHEEGFDSQSLCGMRFWLWATDQKVVNLNGGLGPRFNPSFSLCSGFLLQASLTLSDWECLYGVLALPHTQSPVTLKEIQQVEKWMN